MKTLEETYAQITAEITYVTPPAVVRVAELTTMLKPILDCMAEPAPSVSYVDAMQVSGAYSRLMEACRAEVQAAEQRATSAEAMVQSVNQARAELQEQLEDANATLTKLRADLPPAQ